MASFQRYNIDSREKRVILLLEKPISARRSRLTSSVIRVHALDMIMMKMAFYLCVLPTKKPSPPSNYEKKKSHRPKLKSVQIAKPILLSIIKAIKNKKSLRNYNS